MLTCCLYDNLLFGVFTGHHSIEEVLLLGGWIGKNKEHRYHLIVIPEFWRWPYLEELAIVFLTFWMIFFLVVQNALEIRVIYLDSFICNVRVLGRWKFDDHKWKSNWIVASIIIQDQIFWLSILRSLIKVCKVSIGANCSKNLNKNLKFRAMVQSNRSRNWFSKIFSLENVYVLF